MTTKKFAQPRHVFFLAILASVGLLSADRCPPRQTTPSSPIFVTAWIDATGNLKTSQCRTFPSSTWSNTQSIGPSNSSFGPVIANGKHYWKIVFEHQGKLWTTNATHKSQGALAWTTPLQIRRSGSGSIVSSDIKSALAFDSNNDNWLILFQDNDFRVARIAPTGHDLLNIQSSNFLGLNPQPQMGDISVTYDNNKFYLAFQSTINNKTGIWSSSSQDGGRNWSMPVLVQENTSNSIFYHPVIKSHLGGLHIAAIKRNVGTLISQVAAMYFSNNRGNTWSNTGTTLQSGSFAPNSDEIGMAVGNFNTNSDVCDLIIITPQHSGNQLFEYRYANNSACSGTITFGFADYFISNTNTNMAADGPSVAFGRTLPPQSLNP